ERGGTYEPSVHITPRKVPRLRVGHTTLRTRRGAVWVDPFRRRWVPGQRLGASSPRSTAGSAVWRGGWAASRRRWPRCWRGFPTGPPRRSPVAGRAPDAVRTGAEGDPRPGRDLPP